MMEFILNTIILVRYSWKFLWNPQHANEWLKFAEEEKRKMLAEDNGQK